eukprot:456744-Alexandrium_andersonii.AAC.1
MTHPARRRCWLGGSGGGSLPNRAAHAGGAMGCPGAGSSGPPERPQELLAPPSSEMSTEAASGTTCKQRKRCQMVGPAFAKSQKHANSLEAFEP